MLRRFLHDMARQVESSRWRHALLGAGTLLGVVLLLLTARTALAYSLLGGRWPNQPTSGCCAYLGVVEMGPMLPYDAAAWANGRSAWNNSGANIRFISTSASPITITDTSDGSVSWDGIAYLNPCTNCVYSSATLLLNAYYTAGYPLAKTQSVAAHELGHLAGLGHEWGGCVLMHGYTNVRWEQCGVNIPTIDDINGINALY